VLIIGAFLDMPPKVGFVGSMRLRDEEPAASFQNIGVWLLWFPTLAIEGIARMGHPAVEGERRKAKAKTKAKAKAKAKAGPSTPVAAATFAQDDNYIINDYK
jgi:hypothetical protein